MCVTMYQDHVSIMTQHMILHLRAQWVVVVGRLGIIGHDARQMHLATQLPCCFGLS